MFHRLFDFCSDAICANIGDFLFAILWDEKMLHPPNSLMLGHILMIRHERIQNFPKLQDSRDFCSDCLPVALWRKARDRDADCNCFSEFLLIAYCPSCSHQKKSKLSGSFFLDSLICSYSSNKDKANLANRDL